MHLTKLHSATPLSLRQDDFVSSIIANVHQGRIDEGMLTETADRHTHPTHFAVAAHWNGRAACIASPASPDGESCRHRAGKGHRRAASLRRTPLGQLARGIVSGCLDAQRGDIFLVRRTPMLEPFIAHVCRDAV